jgi:hypothetical protein
VETHMALTNSTVPHLLVYLKHKQTTILAAGQFILRLLLVIFSETAILTFIITYK